MSQELEFILFLGFYSALGVALAVALISGGGPERYGACILVLMLALQLSAKIITGSVSFQTLDMISLLTDLIGLVAFSSLAYFANRFWCLWCASFQLLSISAHFARLADLSVEPVVYATMRTSPTLLVILVLLLGSLAHRRRKQDAKGQIRQGMIHFN